MLSHLWAALSEEEIPHLTCYRCLRDGEKVEEKVSIVQASGGKTGSNAITFIR